ncbi:hypothetical protein V8E54_001423 [Elaphomyces granulatus]
MSEDEDETTVPNVVKDSVQIRDGSRCWAYGYSLNIGLKCCHVIPRNQTQRFLYFQEGGFFPPTLTHLVHPDNLITLCGNYHDEFDSSMPELVIIPTDIEDFIQWEKNDYEHSATDYVWQGAPLAMILKACMALFLPVVEDSNADESTASLQGSRIPENFRATLLQLYSKPTTKTKLVKRRGKGEDADNDDGDNRDNLRRSKRTRKHLDSPNTYEGAFPDDKRRKSLRQTRKRRTRNAKEKAPYWESTNVSGDPALFNNGPYWARGVIERYHQGSCYDSSFSGPRCLVQDWD